jgi:mono/diheme cytochrome c family protein
MTLPAPVQTGNARVPGWAIGLVIFLILIGAIYAVTNAAGTNPDLIGPAPSGEDPNAAAIALIEEAGCQGCHGPDLEGQGAFPNLHGVAGGPVSENLQDLGVAFPDTWANLWIDGTGPEVADLDRFGMPAFAESLTAEDIQTIVDYLLTLE